MLIRGQTDSLMEQNMEMIYKRAGLAEQLGKETFFNKFTKTIGCTWEKFKLDPYHAKQKSNSWLSWN